MPAFLVPIISSLGVAFGGAAGAFLIMEAAFVASSVVLLGGLALSSSQARKAKNKAREQFNAAQVDRLTTVNVTTPARELVMGRVRKGGSVFFRASAGADKTTFLMAIALAAHEIDALEGVYANDELVTLDASGNITSAPYASTVTTSWSDLGTGVAQTLAYTPIAGTLYCHTGSTPGPEGDIADVGYSGTPPTITTVAGAIIQYQYSSTVSKASVRLVAGTDAQAANARMTALFADLWSGAHRARGVAYLVVECTYDETAFPNGLANFTALIRGAKLYDPRQNMLTYSEELDNVAGWTRSSSTPTPNTVAAPNALVEGDTVATTVGTSGGLFQNVSVLPGTTYTFSWYALRSSLLSVGYRVYSNTGAANIVGTTDYYSQINASNWTRISVTFTTPVGCVSMRCYVSCDTGAANSGAHVWGAQLVPGNAPLGYSKTGTAAVSRKTVWSENPALMLRHVYQHPAFGKASYQLHSGNLLSYSEDFLNAYWSKNAAFVAAGATAPDGSMTAQKMNESAVTAVFDVYRAYATTVGVKYTVSFYLKAGERSLVSVSLCAAGLADGAYAYFDLSAGAVFAVTNTGLNSGGAAEIASAGNGWYRCSISITAATTATRYPGMSVKTIPSAAAHAGTAGWGVYAWGAQLNVSEFATVYAMTTSAPVGPATGTVRPDEDDRIIAAADACDRSTTFNVAGVPTVAALFRAAIVLPYGGDTNAAFDDLAQAMAGSWAFAGGELYVAPGVSKPTVMSFTEADIAAVTRDGSGSMEDRPIRIEVHRERVRKINTVVATIWDQGQDYKQAALTPVKSAAYIAADGGAELVQAVQMPAVPFAPQAQHICGVMMRDARDPLAITLPLKMRAYPVEIFDTVDVTLSRYGWTAKLFQVLARSLGAEGIVTLTLKETASSIHALDASFLAQGYAANTALPSPWYVPPMGVLTVTSGTTELLKQADGTVTSRMRVAWPAFTDRSVLDAGTVEVQYRSVLSSAEWTTVGVSGDQTQVAIDAVQDLGVYTVRARPRTRNAIGPWGTQATHTVLGKSEAPPAFDFFTVLVQPDGTRQFNFGYTSVSAMPVDWWGAQIRYVSGVSASPDWATMTPLQDLTTHYTSSPVELNAPLSGVYTFACKSVDTTGNTSAYRIVSILLPDRRLGSVFAEFFELAEGWAGAKTGFQVQDAVLQATDATTWATTPATWAAWSRWNMAPTSPASYVTPHRNLGQTVAGQVNPTIDADGTVVVELATSPDNVTWSGYSTASAPFNARWIRLRVTVTATGPLPVPVMRAFSWQVNSPLKTEYLNDIVISSLAGAYRIGTGDIRIPLAGTYSVLKRTDVVIQDSSAGAWVATRIDQSLSPAPRWQFRLNGTLADPAFVDFYVEGY